MSFVCDAVCGSLTSDIARPFLIGVFLLILSHHLSATIAAKEKSYELERQGPPVFTNNYAPFPLDAIHDPSLYVNGSQQGIAVARSLHIVVQQRGSLSEANYPCPDALTVADRRSREIIESQGGVIVTESVQAIDNCRTMDVFRIIKIPFTHLHDLSTQLREQLSGEVVLDRTEAREMSINAAATRGEVAVNLAVAERRVSAFQELFSLATTLSQKTVLLEKIMAHEKQYNSLKYRLDELNSITDDQMMATLQLRLLKHDIRWWQRHVEDTISRQNREYQIRTVLCVFLFLSVLLVSCVQALFGGGGSGGVPSASRSSAVLVGNSSSNCVVDFKRVGSLADIPQSPFKKNQGDTKVFD